MGKNREYQEKNRPILSILYAVVVIALVAALALMYMNNRQRRSEYKQLVRDAARTDMNLDIESRKGDDEEEEEVEETPTPEPTAQPTEAPSLPDAPLANDEPLNAVAEDGEANEPLLPQLEVEGNAG